ncbi:ABC transporter ATP-binding protein/permease [Carnimonas bestiolae]|uniref:ABC transporter ATP-binding protein/permease n=1 Tax=Carnimonas bestiolae TaxID=3402172 RepID=UPI003EDC509B
MSTSHSQASFSPDDVRLGKRLFARLWRLIKPYWARKACWKSWLILLFLLSSIFWGAYTGIVSSYKMKDMTNALVNHESHTFYWSLAFFIGLSLLSMLTTPIMQIAEAWLDADWRKWLTSHLINNYLARRTYYHIAVYGDLDNPDQRIQENVKPFVTSAASFPSQVVAGFVASASSLGTLMTMDVSMLIAVCIYGVVQCVVLFAINIPPIKQNMESQIAEADLRHGLLHVRENAEAIAFYHGEKQEQEQLAVRLWVAIKKQLKIAYYQAIVYFGAYNILAVVWTAMPFLVLGPKVLSGDMDLGTLNQATMLATMSLGAFRTLANFLPTISGAAPQAVRLAHIQERFAEMDEDAVNSSGHSIQITRGADHVRLHDVCLETPRGEQRLVQHLSLQLDAGQSLSIIGQTGVGKSSLLRAMSALWTRGSGNIEMPDGEECLFLPQRPYMTLSDLRTQIIYPSKQYHTDEELQRVMDHVCLPQLAEKYGGFDAVNDWGRVLSLGEQQRLAFARVIINEPRFVFLDEATSAVDFRTETALYKALAATGASFVSVGHRDTIIGFHTQVLEMKAKGEWELKRPEDIAPQRHS